MYHIIIIPIISALITQIIKLIIDAYHHRFSWSDLNSYGGMPSSHTAMVVSLVTAIGYFEGITTTAFALSLVYALITVRDAIGFRFELGKHAQIINDHIKPATTEESEPIEHLKERLGHTPLQALVGAILGLALTTIYIILFV